MIYYEQRDSEREAEAVRLMRTHRRAASEDAVFRKSADGALAQRAGGLCDQSQARAEG